MRAYKGIEEGPQGVDEAAEESDGDVYDEGGHGAEKASLCVGEEEVLTFGEGGNIHLVGVIGGDFDDGSFCSWAEVRGGGFEEGDLFAGDGFEGLDIGGGRVVGDKEVRGALVQVLLLGALQGQGRHDITGIKQKRA